MVTTFGNGNIFTLFALVLGFVISTATIAYLFMFPAFLILRYKYPNVPRVYKVPGGMPVAWIVTLLPFAYALITVIFILVPSKLPGSISRLTYELTQFIPLILIILLTVVFYIIGHSDKSNRDVLVELKIAEAGEGSVEGVGGE